MERQRAERRLIRVSAADTLPHDSCCALLCRALTYLR